MGDVLTPHVNYGRRLGLAQHHTGTHLLNAALRAVLQQPQQQKREGAGEPETRVVQQRGSLVEERRLRFDFDGDQPLTNQQLEAVELYVQKAVCNLQFF